LRNIPKVRRKSGSLCRYRPEKLYGLSGIHGLADVLSSGRCLRSSRTSGFVPTADTIYRRGFLELLEGLCAGIPSSDEGVELGGFSRFAWTTSGVSSCGINATARLKIRQSPRTRGNREFCGDVETDLHLATGHFRPTLLSVSCGQTVDRVLSKLLRRKLYREPQLALRGWAVTMSLRCRNFRKWRLCQISEFVFPMHRRRCEAVTTDDCCYLQVLVVTEVTAMWLSAALSLQWAFQIYPGRLLASILRASSIRNFSMRGQ
jgi:hypothetical protein